MSIFSFSVKGVLCATAGVLLSALAPAQQPVQRLSRVPASGEARITLRDTAGTHVARSEQLGAVAEDTALTSLSLVLKPSDAQDAALTQLLADQQNPASARYQQWQTPQQFGEHFGAAQADIDLMESWLQGNGFSVQSVPASRNRIVFSGTAAAVERAFRTSLLRYRRDGREFFENKDAVQLPQSLAAVVSGVTGLSSFRPLVPQARRVAQVTASPDYTTSIGNHYIVPDDLRTIYGTNTLIGSGYNGSGIKIGIIGQSAVDSTQLTYFQQKTGQTLNLPTMVLVPNTGNSNKVSGDEGESELDLEYSGGNAPGASIQFIYTGCTGTTSSSALSASVNCNNNGVFDALTYAVTNNLAPILSLSYGGCEVEDATYAISTLEPVLRQANVQGQTILVSSGDAGAAGCENTSSAQVATAGLAVSYPASSPYVTGVGGTQLNSDSSFYWSSTNNSYLGSALGYVPETSWNDTLAYGSLSSSGGGVSKIFAKPSWQAGTGVPADGHRDVPDVAFPANVTEHAYLTCDADGPCTSGNKSFTLSSNKSIADGGGVGGTSAAAPSFAGMLAIVEQSNGGKALGNINPSLYALAAGSSAGTIFHDITTGSNSVACTIGTVDCTTGTLGYNATTGYDLVTGLGSIAIPALRTALQTVSATSSNTVTLSLVSSTTTPVTNGAITFTASAAGTGSTPTGTVNFTVDGGTATSVALVSGNASYTLSGGFTTAGTHTVVATYSGNGTYGASSATLVVTASAGSGSFSFSSSPSTLTISAGNSGTETLTLASSGFTGALTFRAALLSSTSNTFPYCLSVNPGSVSLTNGSTQTAVLTVNTASTCSSKSGGLSVSGISPAATQSSGVLRAGLFLLSVGLVGVASRRRSMASLLGVLALSAGAFGLSGCGSGSQATTSTTGTTTTTTGTTTTSTNSTVTTGTYNLRITAVSSTNTSITASTSFTLVVQ